MKISKQSRTRAQQSRDRKGADLQPRAREYPISDQPKPTGTKLSAKAGLAAPATGPRAYFITFSCYGTRVRGDAAGSVDCRNNVFGTSVIGPNPARESTELSRMDQPSYELDET